MLYRTSHRQTFQLALVSESQTNSAYIIRGGQTFYLGYEGDLLGCLVGPGGFTWISSDFRTPLTDGVLNLHVLSDGGKYSGMFSIDLNAGKLMRSVVDGKEVFRAK